jgi:uncharacterized protein
MKIGVQDFGRKRPIDCLSVHSPRELIPALPPRIAIALAFGLATGLPAQGGVPVPAPRGFVSDFAEVISPAEEARIASLAERVQTGSRAEIAVVTLPDIAGRDVGDIALRIGRDWGVGAKAPVGDRARNAGVVILLVPRESSTDGSGHISIQVGQGAEGFITDGVAGDIRREALPLLQVGAYGQALELITARLAVRYSAEFGFALDSAMVPRQRAPASGGVPPFLLFLVFIAIVVALNMSSRGRRGGQMILPIPIPMGRRRGGWGCGGFGGGFGGFGGGGGFSGGGSSGSF